MGKVKDTVDWENPPGERKRPMCDKCNDTGVRKGDGEWVRCGCQV